MLEITNNVIVMKTISYGFIEGLDRTDERVHEGQYQPK